MARAELVFQRYKRVEDERGSRTNAGYVPTGVQFMPDLEGWET